MRTTESIPGSPRYWTLDIFRGLCAASIFLNHLVLWTDFAPVGAVETHVHSALLRSYDAFIFLFWPVGGLHPAVLCFFILSGFCVHSPFERRIGQPGPSPDWGDYYRRRLRRIMPVYWVGTGLGLLVVAVEHWHPSGSTLLHLHATATGSGVAARILGYCGVWPEEILAGNAPLSTVGVEILIYACYPLFFQAAWRGKWKMMGFVAVAMQLFGLTLVGRIDPFVLFTGILFMALFWYLGALAAHWQQKRGWTVHGAWPLVGWVLFLGTKFIPHFFGLNIIRQAVLGMDCLLLVGWMLAWEQRHAGIGASLVARLLRKVGDSSYSLYAVHTPILFLVNWAMLVFLRDRSYAVQLAANVGLSIAGCALVHVAVEKRFYAARPRL